ncbi:MAG: hypothetical protein HYV95_06260 [Opitutae bacterium]|nr:hypothetical protein [Opitutae bacterium]
MHQKGETRMLVKFDEFGALEITDAAVLDVVAGASAVDEVLDGLNAYCGDDLRVVVNKALDSVDGAIVFVGDVLKDLPVINVHCPQ